MPALPRVFSIPNGASFLATLVDSLLEGRLVESFSRAAGPLALADVTIYVPTLRSARALAETFVARSSAPAVFLPRILPLGHLEGTEPNGAFDGAAEVPAAIGEVARRVILTRLVLQWAHSIRHAILSVDAAGNRRLDPDEPLIVATAPADAWHLSGELANLIDEFIIEDIDWAAFEPFGLGNFDDYWRITLDFLNIAMRAWPAILAERGLVDPATRQKRLIEIEIARLSSRPSRGPVIVAGSTGTNRATAELIAAISRLPQGAVVLPGLDTVLDEPSWALIGNSSAAGHPQATLHRLLSRLGIDRTGVEEIGSRPAPLASRAQFLSEALRPAESTDLWRRGSLGPAQVAEALAEIAVIEAPDERAEALALALALREALEVPARTAALITPDRELARRVRAELRRFGIDVEDSGGEPLALAPVGTLARLIARCAAGGLGAIDVLAVLRHPVTRLGRPPSDLRAIVEAAEVGIFRGTMPPGGIAVLSETVRAAAAGNHAHAAKRRIDERLWQKIERLLADLRAALSPLLEIRDKAPLREWLAAHRKVLLAILRDERRPAVPSDEAWTSLTELLQNLDDSAASSLHLDAGDYASFFERACGDTFVRSAQAGHPRLHILGLLEARLLAFDVTILGGLDEGIWPPATTTDAFLNRPMRAELGLTPPERRIGQTAHDFVEALGAPRAVLSRALKRGGAPTVASRFLLRMAAVAGERRWKDCLAAGRRYLALARALDRPERAERIKRPAPRPPVDLRPSQLSVTRIETLRRDPYSIFAERILRLAPLDPIDLKMNNRDFGTLLHQVLAEFSAGREPRGDLEDTNDRLLAIARSVFAELLRDPDFLAFQWPRLERNLRYFAGWDERRREDISALYVETNGRLTLALAGGRTFELTAVADRIEADRHGRLTIVDFKTGEPPGLDEVAVGFAPQLTLEAAMARAGAFPGIPAGTPVAGALYVKLGTTAEGGKIIDLAWRDYTFDEIVERHFNNLKSLLDDFARQETAYPSRPFPKFASRFGLYDHLARVKEWSGTGGETGDEE